MDDMYERIFAGTSGAIGGLIAWGKAQIIGMTVSEHIPLQITVDRLLEVVLYAFVGTIVGLVIRELWKYFKKLLKNKRHET